MATNHSPISVRHSLIAATLGAGVALAIIHAAIPPAPQTVDRLPVSVSMDLQEDDPGWDCNVHGDRICGDPKGTHAADAWEAWDRTEAWQRLRAATTDTRVTYVGTSTSNLAPKVDALTEVAVPSSDYWYVFRAVPTTPSPRTYRTYPLPA